MTSKRVKPILSNLEYRVVQAQRRLAREQRILAAAVEKLQASGICGHKQTTLYRWEHDDGHGRQTNIEGRRCHLCRAIDHWNRDRWIPEKDIT